MAQLIPTAAYVRKAVRPPRIRTFWKSGPDPFDVHLLELLQTPHTVESLRRMITREVDEQESGDTVQHQVISSMHRLLESELIELSPDS
ncbi:hypothetical protein [Povalibacter sp.]|uniref:hypothetical protein n=1 Tax=Povalibacter sp. TaxID=1962978 RepID=UPI002F4238BF